MFSSDSNVTRAVNEALNACVPKAYRRGGTGATTTAKMYTPTQDPRDIIANLRTLYGKPTPQEKEDIGAIWRTDWNVQEPIEEYYSRMEDCYATAIVGFGFYNYAKIKAKEEDDAVLAAEIAAAEGKEGETAPLVDGEKKV